MAEKKRYIEVNVPIMNTVLRVLGTPENLHGKTIKLDMTRKLRGKGLTVTLQIFNEEGKLIAVPKKMELVKSYIQRMMRKRVDYVEDSFTAQTSDLKVTIKPFLITRKRVSRAVRKNLRNTAKEFIIEYIKAKEYCEICKDLMEGNLQKALLPKLKKVYPLSFCDIRIFETKETSKIDLEKLTEVKEEDIQEVKEEKVEVVEENTNEDSAPKDNDVPLKGKEVKEEETVEESAPKDNDVPLKGKESTEDKKE